MEHVLAAGLINANLETGELIAQIVRAVRIHLRMPFAFVSEFVDGERVFRYVDSEGDTPLLQVGDSGPLADSYCLRVADGRLPPLIPDTLELPVARELPVTSELPIGAHISVPIELANGQVFGTFCCFGPLADHSLNARDLELMVGFSRVIARQIEQQMDALQDVSEKRERVERVIEHDKLTVFFQPIRSLTDMRIAGFEVLSRFPGGTQRSPHLWFADAQDAGLGTELELLAIQKGLRSLPSIANAYLALNVSPATVLSGQLEPLFQNLPHHRIVLEITEHALVNDYLQLNEALLPLRRNSVRIAIDDVGSGYSTMRHILELKPDVIKLDAQLTINLEHDATKRALVKALATFAGEIRCDLVAEGIETPDQKDILMQLGVRNGQGYLLGRPSPLGAFELGKLDSVRFL
jgi:EAL domain-containing protein (putative c-di-GMP-specific phosphodiesterase class I)